MIKTVYEEAIFSYFVEKHIFDKYEYNEVTTITSFKGGLGYNGAIIMLITVHGYS